jgi:phosphohistidine phosphatase
MTTAPRELMILRHAKAEPFAARDHDRRLTARGVADATDAGHWARDEDRLPDHVVVSSAARTCGTWNAFRSASGGDAEVHIEPALYPADTDAALEILRLVPSDARRVMVVGHNPTMASLVQLLDDGDADPEVLTALSAGYPTSALTVLAVQAEWADLSVGGARIEAYHVGRG